MGDPLAAMLENVLYCFIPRYLLATIGGSLDCELCMEPCGLKPRTSKHLSQINTNWTQLGLVHDATVDSTVVEEARRELLHRYAASVYQYVRACVRDDATADDLAQEFAVRFLDGRYDTANRDRGRFRDFLKRCLSNLVTDHFRRVNSEKKHLNNIQAEKSDVMAVKEFDSHWQRDMLTQAWKAFEVDQTADSPAYVVLRHRAEFPEESAAEIANFVAGRLPDHAPVTDAWVRQTLHRARKSFAQLLRNEVSATLIDPTPEAVNEELGALGLLKYCDS